MDGDEDQEPVVIISLSEDNADSNHAASGYTGSPMANLLMAKKRRALLVLVVPLIFALAFRMVSTETPLPENTLRSYLQASSHNINNNNKTANRKVVDVNAPPVDLPEGETMAHLVETKGHDTEQQKHANPVVAAPHFTMYNPLRNAPTASFSRAASLVKAEEKPLPVIIDRGEKIPAGVGVKKVSAAEALMCRESVINYVINATNGKDECHGLQKAFDETCSQEDEELPLEEDPKIMDQNDIWLGQEPGTRRGRRRRLLTRKRRLKRWNQQDLVTFITEEAYRYAELFSQWIPQFQKPRFFPEDTVFGLFPKAKRNEIMREKRRRQRQQRQLEQEKNGSTQVEVANDLQDDDALVTNTTEDEDDTVLSLDEETQPPVKVKTVKPHTILSLPTGQMHVSGKTLENTLLLQHEDKVLSNLKKATAAHNVTTNVTKIDAKEDAAASAKAVADTSEMVSAILNDPTSIEARACCASILNVYHENCNVDAEEDISDKRLFIVVLIMAFCGMVKSLIRHFKIRWLPEAAGCILVGVASGYASSYFPHQDFSFDGNWFLRILVPPIGKWCSLVEYPLGLPGSGVVSALTHLSSDSHLIPTFYSSLQYLKRHLASTKRPSIAIWYRSYSTQPSGRCWLPC